MIAILIIIQSVQYMMLLKKGISADLA